MNKKISLGAALALMLIVTAVTFSITMIFSRQTFSTTVTNISEREAMYDLSLIHIFLHDVQSSLAQHGKFCRRKGDCRCNDDRVAGVYADRVHVFHRADGDDVAFRVTDNLKFDLFPAGDALLYQKDVYKRQP